MKAGRIIVLVIGCFLLIPGIAMLFGGAGLTLASATQRDDDGFFDVTIDRIDSETVAVTAEDLTFAAEPGSPDWLIDALDADVRLRVTGADTTRDVFVGIARERDVETYLSDVGHDEVIELDAGRPVYRNRAGGDIVDPPADQTFWTISSSGAGTQTVTWEAASGRWVVVVMNADGSPGVSADVNAGIRAGFVLPLGLTLLGLGLAVTAASVAMLVAGSQGSGDRRPRAAADGEAAETGREVAHPTPSPVLVEATLDPELSRWLWLVKWILAIPHVVVLVFLWVAFAVLTLVAGVAILFAGRYPRGIFDFNVGVMRWSWRVQYYAASGGLGTDRYPPFSLHAEPGDPARLDVVYPERLHRGLVLVKWFLAIPHLVLVVLLSGGSIGWLIGSADNWRFDVVGGGGLIGLLVLVAGATLLFTGRYPTTLFDLIVGFNRWIYRVTAYVALMTDVYPPFRLDQGGAEPDRDRPVHPLPAPTAVHREPMPDRAHTMQ